MTHYAPLNAVHQNMMDVPNNKSLSKKFKSSKDHNNDISKTLKTPHTAAKAIQEDLRQD